MDTVAKMLITLMRPVAVLALLATIVPQPTLAQDGEGSRIIPTNAVVISGYGTVGYLYRTEKDAVPNSFSASFSPVFLFQFQDRFLFETELEFDVEDGVTQTGLEYAQLDVIASDNVVLVGGKFLVPFGAVRRTVAPHLDQ